MSSTAPTSTQPSKSRPNEPTFLGLPAELRIAIYKCTLIAECATRKFPPKLRKYNFNPFAWAKVNRQLRHGSMPIYYDSVEFLRLPVGNGEGSSTKQFLNEVDLTAFSELPDLRFDFHVPGTSWTGSLVVSRWERFPAQELQEYMDMGHDNAVVRLYREYIGHLDYEEELGFDSYVGNGFEHFKQVLQQDGTWISRDRIHYTGYLGMNIGLKLVDIAKRLEGRDWDKGVLDEILDWFEQNLHRLTPDPEDDL